MLLEIGQWLGWIKEKGHTQAWAWDRSVMRMEVLVKDTSSGQDTQEQLCGSKIKAH